MGEALRVVRDRATGFRSADAFVGDGTHDHGRGAAQGLEHLVLEAGADPQRIHGDASLHQRFHHGRHEADDFHAVTSVQAAYAAARVPPDDPEAHVRPRTADEGQDVLREVQHRVLVGPERETPREDEVRPFFPAAGANFRWSTPWGL